MSKNGDSETVPGPMPHGTGNHAPEAGGLHPSWRAFVRFCFELGYGDIERLRIQDGLPVLAEVTKKKVKFAL